MFDVEVISFSELCIVETLDQVMMKELIYPFCVQESSILDIQEMSYEDTFVVDQVRFLVVHSK